MTTKETHCTNDEKTIQYPFINPLHGQLIDYKELDQHKRELSRISYIRKCFPKINSEVDCKLKKKQDILFMPIDVRDDMNLQDAQYQPAIYKITICGILEDGRKATVLLNGIHPYIEVQVPHGTDPEPFKDDLIDDLMSLTPEIYDEITKRKANQYFSVNMDREHPPELVQGKYFKEFVEYKSMFVRIYFSKLDARRSAIIYLVAKGHQVVHDDLNNYFRVVCRDYLISFNVWIHLTKYKCETDNERIRGLVLSVDIRNYSQYSAEVVQTVPHLQKDPTLSMCWDGEMFKKFDPTDKEPPRPQYLDHKLFMIGTTFQWYYVAGNQQLLRVCFVDKPSIAHPDYLTVVCGEEKYVIKAFIRVWMWMHPDLILGFNDGEYDWPWLKSRAEHYGLLKFMAKNLSLVWASDYGGDPWENKKIVKRYYKSSQYKLDAETSISCYKFSFPGCVAIDVRTIFRQLFPNDEASSLNHYLTRLDIQTKLDMNFKDMFDMYEEMDVYKARGEALPERLLILMQQVAHYCVIDAQRCHELMVKLYVIMDKRAVSNMSYVSFLDAIERANGMKVRNLIIAEGQQPPFLLKFNNNAVALDENEEKSQFPGAYVFPPKKGLVNGKLTMEERIVAGLPGWNEVSESDISQANKLIENHGAVIPADVIGKTQLPQTVKEFLAEEIRRPITGLDFNSLYPSLMMTYNLSPEYMILDKKYAKEMSTRHTLFPIRFPFKGVEVRGWAVRHDNHIDPTKPEFKFGIFGFILKQLFDKRKAIKGQMKVWEKKSEECQEDTPEHAVARFQYEYLNSTQKALKVFMNTFYGEIGNQRSPFFMVQVAGGVTTNGGRNVKLAQKLLEDRNCKVYYGDSLVADEPLLLQDEFGDTVIRTIDDLVDEKEWQPYPQFKLGQEGRIEKQQASTNYRIWTDDGWKEIRRVIRHKTNKKVYRISTHTGCVDVTEDHSLLKSNLEHIKPSECKIGVELLHSFPAEFNLNICDNKMTKIKAFELGRLLAQTNIDAVPDVILKSNINTRKCFLLGYIRYSITDNPVKLEFYCGTKVISLGLYYLVKSLREYSNITIECIDYELNIFKITANNKPITENPIAINNIFELTQITQEEYVYDIETESGRFNAGVGALCIKNSDSCYSSMPDRYFIDVDRQYFLGQIEKEAYWARLVEITLEAIVKVRDEVNDFFMQDNGTKFLTMAFEEVLFPVLFASKKKYVGVAHEHGPEFKKPLNVAELFQKYIGELTIKFPEYTPEQVLNAADDAVILKRKKHLFIRGLDIVKRGMPNFSKEIILDILEQMIAIHNTKELFDIVKSKICDIYARKWDDPKLMYKFIMTDQYKPHKKNEKMHVFVRRMAEAYNIQIKPFERSRYIIALKYPYKFNIRGNKESLSMGELMELADIAIEHGHIIDINEYMKSKVFGQLGRLIAYRPEFRPPNADDVDMTDVEAVKSMEKKIYDAAVKWVIQFSSQYSDKHCMLGPIHSKISKAATQITYSRLEQIDIGCKKLFTPKTNEELENLPIWIATKAEAEAKAKTRTHGKKFVNDYIKKYIDANNLTKDQLPLNRSGDPIYKSVKEYVCTRINIFYRRILPLAERVFIANNERIMRDLIRHLNLLRQIYYKFNDMVKTASDYVVANSNIEPLYEQGVTKLMMMTQLESIKNFIVVNQTKMAEQIVIDDELENAIAIYNRIYVQLIANYITIYRVRNIYAELQNIKDTRVGHVVMKKEEIDINAMADEMIKPFDVDQIHIDIESMLDNMD